LSCIPPFFHGTQFIVHGHGSLMPTSRIFGDPIQVSSKSSHVGFICDSFIAVDLCHLGCSSGIKLEAFPSGKSIRMSFERRNERINMDQSG
jgi:hypothetical protein